MKRICVWGTSFKKVADEAQLLAIHTILTEKFPGASIHYFARYGEFISGHRPEIRATRIAQVFRIVSLLSKADLLLIVGGPFYEAPFQALTCFSLFIAARLFRCTVAAYGITLFPFRTWWGKILYRGILNRLSVIEVRDAIGIDILRELGVTSRVTSGADPRYVLEPAPPERVREIFKKEMLDPDQPAIAITTRYLHAEAPKWVRRSHAYSSARVNNANDVMGRVLAALSDHAQLIIIPMHPSHDEDDETAAALRAHLRDPSRLKVLTQRYSATEVIGIIHHCGFLLAGRQGSAIFATATATPMVAVAYEARMIDHMQRAGQADCVFDWKTIEYEPLMAKIVEVQTTAAKNRAMRLDDAKQWKQRAWDDAALLETLI
ncbi:MAG: polysaccharide pyruvyl transferase family protein [Candidatus Hydrogenedentes bacterium]|nr:polysaccharide pyruvyl transferase family protein [Candidatus Hydrogenedentota bacterium]